MREYLTVSEINTYLRNKLTEDNLLYNVKIVGEVSSYSTSGNNSYFTIKDNFSCISVCCFSYYKTYEPKNGEGVLISGTPDYYIKSGKLSFIAEKIQPFGEGNIFAKLEELKIKLQAEGIFSEEHKKPIPKFPKDVLVITSVNGAVIQDIITTVRKKNTYINLAIYDVKVQGENSAKEIVKAIKKVDKLAFDCIILARGGGSAEDLMPFNDEELTRAVYNCVTPIISAVGHETDFSLTDFAADLRALTPTDAGNKIAFNDNELILDIKENLYRIYDILVDKINQSQYKIKYMSENILVKCDKKIDKIYTTIKNFNVAAYTKIDNRITKAEYRLKNIINRLQDNSPTNLLNKGYFKLVKDNKVLTELNDIKEGDTVSFSDFKRKAVAKIINIGDNNE